MPANIHKDKMSRAKTAMKWGFGHHYSESGVLGAKGVFTIEMHDSATGELLERRVQENIITLDAGILAAMLFSNRTSSRGLHMLAIGTGATGALLSPDAPDPRQRNLNAEIARKAFSTRQFRDGSGAVSAIPTNIVDFTTIFGEGEAVGPLNEMGLISPISENPLITTPVGAAFPTYDTSIDLTQFDIQVNYLSFPVISKPSTAIMTVTWRLSF